MPRPPSRRRILKSLSAGVLGVPAISNAAGLNRRALVERNAPVLHARNFNEVDLRSPLTVGNGRFAFTPDVTGLQSFPDLYEQKAPLCTQSEWGWHSFPNPKQFSLEHFRMTPFASHGREVGYPVSGRGQEDAYKWLRENPHRMHLGRIGLRISMPVGPPARAEQVEDIHQTLDLWNGILRSRFRIGGAAVAVETWCHPTLDLLVFRVASRLIREGRIAAVIEFPYGSAEMAAADWSQPDRHRTVTLAESASELVLMRQLDAVRYYVDANCSGRVRREGPHRFEFHAGRASDDFEVAVRFSRERDGARVPTIAQSFEITQTHWNHFWQSGGAVELGGDSARELERRIVLSQYQTAIQCAGSMPPQETGLMCNSWHGKFHLEMHWWHAAHFALWGRAPVLERSLAWYRSILPRAIATAERQGYGGARWPKMTSPEGVESPSPIGPLLIWQQPHPIAMAELCYAANPDRDLLERHREIVFASADFMASFAVRDSSGRFALGPPVIPAQENHPPSETWNPTYELEYWGHVLRVAQQWRERLGLPRNAEWDAVIEGLAPLPVKDGIYLAHANCPQTYTERNADHPSMLAAFGVLGGSKVDAETMRRTLAKVLTTWK